MQPIWKTIKLVFWVRCEDLLHILKVKTHSYINAAIIITDVKVAINNRGWKKQKVRSWCQCTKGKLFKCSVKDVWQKWKKWKDFYKRSITFVKLCFSKDKRLSASNKAENHPENRNRYVWQKSYVSLPFVVWVLKMYEAKTESDQEHCQPHNILSQVLHHTRCFGFYGVLWKLIKEECEMRTFLHHNAEVTWKNKSCKVDAKLDMTKSFMFGIPTESWAFKVQSKITNFTQNQNWKIPLFAW